MRKNETSQALFFQTKQDYNIHSKLYHDIVLFCHSQKDRKKYEISLPFLIEGKIGQIGCKYMLIQKLDSKIKIFYKLIEYISTDYFTHIKSHAYKTIPATFEYDYVIDLFYNGLDEALIFSTFIYNNSIQITDYEIHYEMMKRKNEFLCNEIFIENKEHLKLSKAEININVNINILWRILLNMKVVHKYVKLICKEIKYKDDLIHKGINIILNYNNSTAKGIVSECRKKKSCALIDMLINEFIGANDEENSVFCNPISNIRIILYEYKKQTTIYLFFCFEKEQNMSKLMKFQYRNEIELLKLKNIVEHFKNNKKLSIFV